jgi:deoxyadenosine/deoxycytidine kinase
LGKLIAVVGNLGAGKTTLTRRLCEQAAFVPLLENPESRPFQQDLSQDLARWSLANQLDFFAFRAEQEMLVRQSDSIGIQDGGLDQDFHVFTQHLFNKGFMGRDEYSLCVRTYKFLRQVLSPPEVLVRLKVPIVLLPQRRKNRSRPTDEHLVYDEELHDLETLLDQWLSRAEGITIVHFQATAPADFSFEKIQDLVATIRDSLAC